MRTKEDYEQMALDTRTDLELAIEEVAEDAIDTARSMVERHYQIANQRGHSYTGRVRNRHEAYGIAAEQHNKIMKSVNTIKGGVSSLLGTLADPNYNAIEATSSIVNSITDATGVMIRAAAEMKRTLDDLYMAETFDHDPTPLDELAESGGFQEAESLDAEEDEDAETGDNETEE